jgi:Cof subfamily protein (haloacid dehalogenase superfamily)
MAAPIKLIATDLDGTLLRSDGTLSPRTRRALTGIVARGIHVVIATARPFRALRPLLESSPLQGWGVCQNGAVVYELGSLERVLGWELESAVARSIVVELRRELDGVAFACEMDDLFHCEPHFASRLQAMEPPQVTYGDALDLIVAPLTKLLVHHRLHGSEQLAQVTERVIGARATVTHSGAGFVEISAAGVTKASAIEALCVKLGIARAEVIAFGDMPNDLPMMRWAGRCVAVANAHADVLGCADEISPSNDDDGVAVLMERILSVQEQSAADGA